MKNIFKLFQWFSDATRIYFWEGYQKIPLVDEQILCNYRYYKNIEFWGVTAPKAPSPDYAPGGIICKD